LTVSEAADVLGCSVSSVKRRIRTGALPAFVDGRLVRVRDADLDRYVAARVIRAAPASERGAGGIAIPNGARLWD
jgi:excisionase family DNA binding protein